MILVDSEEGYLVADFDDLRMLFDVLVVLFELPCFFQGLLMIPLGYNDYFFKNPIVPTFELTKRKMLTCEKEIKARLIQLILI